MSQQPTEAAQLRALLEAVLEAVALPHEGLDHARRMEIRADWVRATLKGALAEDPANIGWNADFLRGRIAAEEAEAAERAARASVDRAFPLVARFLADGQDQAARWVVQEKTRGYAAELRDNPGAYTANGHTGWECGAGASLLAAVESPGKGRLPNHHGVIYTCAGHQAEAEARITAAGYDVTTEDAPPSHRWNPWPCGHTTAHGARKTDILTALARRDADDDPYGDVDKHERGELR